MCADADRSRRRGRWLIAALLVPLVALGPAVAHAQLNPGAVKIPPRPTNFLNDYANIIPPENAAHINAIAQQVQTKSPGEIAIVTLADIGDRAPADVALTVLRQWGVGKKGNPGDTARNAGAVILLVPKETSSDGRGHCFITTGNATEGFITDADAGDMCRAAIPYFRTQNYGAGLELVTDSTAQRFANEYHFTYTNTLPALVPAPGGSGGEGGGIPPQALFFLLLVVFIILSSIARRGGGRRGCLPIFIPYGGGWGGGGWSGGEGEEAAGLAGSEAEAEGAVVEAVPAGREPQG